MSVFCQESLAKIREIKARHDLFEEHLRNKSYILHSDMYQACQSNCYTCLNLIISSHAQYGLNPGFLPNYLHVWEREHPEKNAHYRDFIIYIEKLKMIMPLLVGVHKREIPFCKHPLYTRDVLRAILRLACKDNK